MTEPTPEHPALTIAETGAGCVEPFGTGGLVIFGSVCTAIGVGASSKDWCSSTVGSAFLTTTVICVLNPFVLFPIARLYRWGRGVQVLLPLVLAASFTAALWLDEPGLFRQAFGPDRPPGIKDPEVISNEPDLFAGGNRYLLRFTATPEAIKQLVDRGDLRRNQVIIPTWQASKQTWDELLKQALKDHPPGWASIKPMSQPAPFHGEPEAGGSITVLWDGASGSAYAAFTHP